MQTFREVVNERDWIWIGHDPRYHDYLVEGFRKVEGGVKHLVIRLKQPYLENIDQDLEKYGVFSKRPFAVGQGCDGSGGDCCFALYFHFCMNKGFDPIAMHREAYFERDGRHYQEPQPEEIKKLADWQGVAYPSQWTEQTYQGLIKSLYDINNRSLVEVLTNTVDESNVFSTELPTRSPNPRTAIAQVSHANIPK
ncbi:MAG: hypothetical protein HC852_01720 [Acaryochloridaceae cyanobacterium RU_4_10]|nr:hypothetical protein [Acaryochloridaceae cyanobacterium RU_4_10]